MIKRQQGGLQRSGGSACVHAVQISFYLLADTGVFESSEAQFSFLRRSSVTRKASASSFPQHIHKTSARLQGDGSPRASGLPDAGVHLPRVVRERRQMSRGFPASAGLLYISMCTKRLCRRRDEGPLVSKPHVVLQRKAQTVYGNTSGGAVIFPPRL